MTETANAPSKLTLPSLFRRAPIYAFYALLKLIPENELLGMFLHRFRVVDYSVKGTLGVFEGSADDVDVIGRYAVEQTWSPVFLKRFTDYLGSHPDTTYLDIGANIGLTAIPVAAAGYRVIAFEPVPGNFDHLAKNVARNGVGERMTILNKALLEKPGSATFELSPSNHGDHRYRTDTAIDAMGESGWSVAQVVVDTLDSVLADVGGSFAVKMDTQGSEPLVILGGREALARTRMILCEFSPYQMKRMGTDARVLIDYLSEFDAVEIYVCEENAVSRTFADKAAVKAYLSDYYDRWQSEPWGRYLNVLGTRG